MGKDQDYQQRTASPDGHNQTSPGTDNRDSLPKDANTEQNTAPGAEGGQSQPGDNVHHVEDDSGFFITGINTHGGENEMLQEEAPAIEEEADPVDKYKHVAVVDCSKAFSNQEVSANIIYFIG